MSDESDSYAELTRRGVPHEGPQVPATLTYGPHPDHIAEVYGHVDAPAIVLVHGGYFRPSIDRGHARLTASVLGGSGWQVVLPEYRRVPGDPGASTADLADLDAHLRRLGVGVLGWVGHSAGGTLALLRGLSTTLPPIRAVGLAALTDLAAARTAGLGDGAVDDWVGATSLPEVDPRSRLDAHPDPRAAAGRLLLLHGDADETVDPAQATALDVPHEILAGAHHFDLVDPGSRSWPRVLAALRAHLGDPVRR